ncbi:manganese peroxidase 1 precursor [Armillaria borealis]|uniref:Peroxidase n=1 Tax=Armillaria borealis TaxID=47425 RepID=A0AA39IXT3_9AGAR|nr:manganese peroxidase 1 precursor [Armillaria borealis]
MSERLILHCSHRHNMAFAPLLALIFSLAVVRLSDAALTKRVACPDGIHTVTNEACCALFPVIDDLQKNLFEGGECREEVHESLRLTFHDAIAWSDFNDVGGGADGSIVTFSEIETNFHANDGIDEIVETIKPFIARHNITAGDFIQLSGAVGLTNCPGAPQLNFLFGRPAAIEPAQDKLVPEPFDTVTDIIARFTDAGVTTPQLIALLSSHTVAAADKVDVTVGLIHIHFVFFHSTTIFADSGVTPFDSTPGIFDTQIFIEVQLRGTQFPGTGGNHGEVMSPLAGEMRLQSDHTLSTDSRTDCIWQSFANNPALMRSEFKSAMLKLSTLGQDLTQMVDCSEVIPQPLAASAHGPHLPAGQVMRDIEQACATAAFPTLTADRGPATSVAPV